jgi:hypothetical protein
MPNQTFHGDDVMSTAHVRTIDDDVLISLRDRRGEVRSLDLNISDLGNKHGKLFDWVGWRGKMAGEKKCPHDSATLRFRGEAGTDAVIYGLWKTTDQLFRNGRGITLPELKLTLEQLPSLFTMNPPQLRVAVVINSPTGPKRITASRIKHVSEAPIIARKLFKSFLRRDDFVCITVELLFHKASKGDRTPVAIFAPSTDSDREGAFARVEKYGAKYEHFYFDFKNEQLVLEIAIWQATELLRRHYAEKAVNRDRELLRSIHSQLRHLTIMHDVASHNHEVEMVDWIENYPGLDLVK